MTERLTEADILATLPSGRRPYVMASRHLSQKILEGDFVVTDPAGIRLALLEIGEASRNDLLKPELPRALADMLSRMIDEARQCSSDDRSLNPISHARVEEQYLTRAYGGTAELAIRAALHYAWQEPIAE